MRNKVVALMTAGIVIIAIWALSVVLRPPPINIVAVQVEAAGLPPPYFYPGFTLSEGQHFAYTFRFPFNYSQRVNISSLYVNTVGFTIDSVSPNLPYSLAPNSSVTFTIRLVAPNKTYGGPLALTFGVLL